MPLRLPWGYLKKNEGGGESGVRKMYIKSECNYDIQSVAYITAKLPIKTLE